MVAYGVERPEGAVVPVEAAQERLSDGEAAQVHAARHDGGVGGVAVGEVCLPPEVVEGGGRSVRVLDVRHGTGRRCAPFPAVHDVTAGEYDAAEGREGGALDAGACEVPAGAAREVRHGVAVLGEEVRLAHVPRSGVVGGRIEDAGEEHQHVGTVPGLVLRAVQLHLRQPVGEGVVRVVVVVRVDGTLHREGLGLARVVPEFYGHRLEARQLEEPLPGAPVEDACRLAEKVVRLGHLRRLLEGHAVREDGRAGVKFVAGVDALRAVSLAVVLRVLLRELALAAVAHLIPALVREDRVGDYLLAAVDAPGEVEDARAVRVEGGAGYDAHLVAGAVPHENEAEVLGEVREVAHGRLAGAEDVVHAVGAGAVLGGNHAERPPCVRVVGVGGVEERGVQRHLIASVVAGIADGGDESLDGHDGPLEIPAEVRHFPLRVRVGEADEGAVEAGLVCPFVGPLVVLVHACGYVRPRLVVHEGVAGVEVGRETVVARREVDDVPEGLELRLASSEEGPGVLHGVGTWEHAEVRDVIAVHVAPDEVGQRPGRAVVLAGEGVEERAEAAVERHRVGVPAVVRVHRVEAAVAGFQDGAVAVVEHERRLARGVELGAVIADAEKGAAVQAEGRAEHAVVPARSGERDLVAGGVDDGGGVGHLLARPVVENPGIVGEVHHLPGDVELHVAFHRRTMSWAVSTLTA